MDEKFSLRYLFTSIFKIMSIFNEHSIVWFKIFNELVQGFLKLHSVLFLDNSKDQAVLIYIAGSKHVTV